MASKAAQLPKYGASIRTRQRTDGTLVADVRYRHEGAARTRTFDTPAQAEKWAALVRRIGPDAAIEYLRLDIDSEVPTIEEYLDTYLATKSGVEPLTIEHYRMFMRLHIAPTLGHLPLDGITKTDIAAWVNAMDKAGSAAKSIKNRHSFLYAMLQNAVDDRLIPANPCARTRLPNGERQEMVFLSADEFTVLLGYIPPKYQTLVLLLAATGMRWGEVSALRPVDFDLDRRTVRISRSWKRSYAEGPYIGPPKTKRSNRTIELPPDLIPALRDQLAKGGEYVFTNDAGRPLRQAFFWKCIWAPARNLANGRPPYDHAPQVWLNVDRYSWAGIEPAKQPINKWPRIHDLRHSSVAWLLERGVGIDVISRRLGHESIKTTMDVYGHVAPQRMWDAADQIGVALSGAMPALEQ